MRNKKYKFNSKSAQSIIELSLLGAALLGILGMLISYCISLGNNQETQLKAMRAAMKLSAESMDTSLAPMPSSGYYSYNNSTFNETTNLNPDYKSGHRKSAAVLWIEDRPTVEGGGKYGASSLTPTISFGSGSFTNFLQYPIRWGDPTQLPYLDMYINGKHFAFTTFGYRYIHLVDGSDNPDCSSAPSNRRCLSYVPSPNHGLLPLNACGSGPCHPVGWVKIPRTDFKFCFGPNDPSDHYCNESETDVAAGFDERWRLDPVVDNGNGPIVPVAQRHDMQWQWFPVLLNDVIINFYGTNHNNANQDTKTNGITSLDIDYDGHEETILKYYEIYPRPDLSKVCMATYDYYGGDGEPKGEPDVTDLNYTFNDPDCDWFHHWDGEGYVYGNPPDYADPYWRYYYMAGAWVIDNQIGDIDMGWNAVDKNNNIPKPGFIQGKANIITTTAGELNIDQQKVGTNSQNISYQKDDTISIIERQIQLSFNTGRFDHNRPAYMGLDQSSLYLQSVSDPDSGCYAFDSRENSDVDISCPNSQVGHACNTCNDPDTKYLTCFDSTTNILYVRSITGKKAGHKYKTQQPLPNWP